MDMDTGILAVAYTVPACEQLQDSPENITKRIKLKHIINIKNGGSFCGFGVDESLCFSKSYALYFFHDLGHLGRARVCVCVISLINSNKIR